HHPDPMAALALFLSGYKGKVVLHWHSDIIRQRFFLYFYRWLQNWLIRRAEVVVGTSPDYIKSSEGLAGARCNPKTAVLPIGVKPLKRDIEGEQKIRSRWPGKKIVFSLGRLIPYKGFEYLVEANKYLPDNYVTIIGGQGPLKESLMEQIKVNGLEHKVHLIDNIPESEKAAYFGAGDLYCMSSITKNEAFGIVMIEAMSLGKPVVSTKIPESGVPWVNKDGVSGINVEPKDAAALASAIKEICENDDTYALFSAGAGQRFEKEFSLNKMIDGLTDIYSRIYAQNNKIFLLIYYL
ncbi:MAG: glycosyltransferase, partial [Bacteroidales bacterium]|nr:glycosyltransferase [Bacteroidales bacterium]